ncbi:low affinity iron permease family protein [Rhodococcus sp. NPDC003318]|uniref:low affinity iron permease family protein n=1 Tax=Rhodococcus sp. NPDC003318 TaxID=3364503 RepID=UPI003695DB45
MRWFRAVEVRLAGASTVTSRVAGSAWAPTVAAGAIVVLLAIGGLLGFSPGWAYFVHTIGALVSVFMLFVVQHSTRRESNAILLKLDELIHSSQEAHDELLDVEDQEVREQEILHDALHHDDAGDGADRHRE